MKKVYQDIIKDIDSQKREVVFKFSKFNNYDSDNDIILPTAFDKTMAESGPKGANRIYHLWQHDRKNNPPIGKLIDMWRDNEYAYAHSKMMNSDLANAIFDGYMNGAIKEHSFWAKTYNPGVNERGGKIIKEARLLEVSTVIWGANENAQLVEVIKSNIKQEPETALQYIIDLRKWVKNAKATDDFIQTLEIELMKAEDILESLEKPGHEINIPDPIKPKIELTLADIWKLKNL